MGVRKNATRMTTPERESFLRAVLVLKNTIANPGDAPAKQISIYDQFVALHLGAINITFGGVSGLNMGHQNSAFCPWHRYYLHLFEQALQSVDPTVMLPYWDWTDHFGTQTILFQDTFLGPDGTGSIHGFGERSVQSGYFAFNKPGTGGNPTALPGWWPPGLAGWRVRPSLAQGHADPGDPSTGNTLQRFFDSFANLANLSDIQNCLSLANYEGTSTTNSFRRNVEAAAKTHNFHHGWVGGNMGDPNSSPNDLVFFLHHCNIDRLWAMWQIDGHAGAAYYPASGRPQGHNLNDPMWPWVGSAAGYSAPNLTSDIVLPDFTASPVIHPADALDHRALGYCYDSEAIVGLALDQTGSMTQMTPDPMVVAAPDVTKWEAAKRGVAAFLHDCETAYAQREGYVIAGIETFRSLAANVFSPVFAGVPYGLIKAGAAYSEAGFNSAIATHSPAGGTPIAGALLDTETTLVRAPFGGLPVHDNRFLLLLTDGMETAAPPLSSILPGQLADTVIFAMGFGTGSDVNYAAMADVVAKGKSPPPLVTNQVYHGENAGEINKFFTNSVAHALGYTPVIDPVYEVFIGEHVDTPFLVTEADQSFMITVQGFDFDDDHWRCCLILPNGSSCSCDGACDEHEGAGHDHNHATGSAVSSHQHDEVLVTSNKRSGRTTIFMNRNGAESERWVGRWQVRVMYRMTAENMRMFMPSAFDRLIPAGAPRVRGSVFAQAALPAAKRLPMRLLPAQSAQNFFPVAGANEDRHEASTVAVNVYARSTLQVGLVVKQNQGGGTGEFKATVAILDVAGVKVSSVSAIGRMVAPRISTSKALRDYRALSPAQQKRFVIKAQGETFFDEAKFLAQYEAKRPGAFAMRDELLELTATDKRKALAVTVKTGVPGIYRLAIQVSGTLMYEDDLLQPFTRILNFEVAVGSPRAGKEPGKRVLR
jgi:hypothetical protein